MDAGLKEKLVRLGLSEDQILKLDVEGVQSEEDLGLLNAHDIKQATGCNLLLAAKIVRAGAPSVPVLDPIEVAPDAEIPEGTKPSPAQVNTFAASMGMDPNMLSIFMVAGMANNAGVGMDLSGMIPVPQIVAGYNPKIRNMFLMIMDQVENRLGVPIVVIDSDGGINRDLTVEYIMGLEEGRDPAENNVYFDSAGMPYQVIQVGVDAQSIYDADPLDSTRALQKNGMGTGRINWINVSDAVRQTAYYAVTRTHEIDPKNDAHLAWLRDHIKPSSNHLVFSGQAPNAISEFNEGRRTGSLPTLRVMLTRGPRRVELMPRRRRVNPRDPRDLAGIGKEEL
ncbi:MAG: hypothetical protein A3J55_04385 [Candidatus Ryanbacteria bacterium RIFCSPHIGHO2_02_FULL_45_17b]|uniref:Uncharacterized protein n=1 Tax=Candidatus Ryanbacteria bacterium RIFCSPHIGHO2_01_FULL_45_22 TaxID=1802114 RepID=A0A1G2G3F9_9BACT|nr:MAG: hypothetical protein A2719_04960 [Candidatus Ryanbacteria bacterium RIFCSPHIGHO2_01_FULL_45_22]OGZ47583.1 MAG: hypothetical protein A3J55_04385 [Candidatus Ryanbacteria bacterium RIFCSPHIGHO2_02_FULL_45_17b]